jgi:hypothetical protein
MLDKRCNNIWYKVVVYPLKSFSVGKLLDVLSDALHCFYPFMQSLFLCNFITNLLLVNSLASFIIINWKVNPVKVSTLEYINDALYNSLSTKTLIQLFFGIEYIIAWYICVFIYIYIYRYGFQWSVLLEQFRHCQFKGEKESYWLIMDSIF